MPTAKPTRLLIVDGHAYAYRAFHAIRQLSSPAGAPTNAIFGFIKMLTKMRASLAPSHAVVIWDGGLAAQRVAEHPSYKSQRPPMPADLEPQLDAIQRYLDAVGVVSLCREGVEADDWIASLARRLAPQLPVVIASSDKDFLQLVSDRIGILNPNDKTEKIWGAEDVRTKTGVAPNQIVDWLALVGDSVDNIPGVSGVGPKTAADLLRQFESVEKLFTRLEEVKSERLRAGLRDAAQVVVRNQRLIGLHEIPETPALDALDPLALRAADTAGLRGLFADWGFRTMLAELPQPVTEPEQKVFW